MTKEPGSRGENHRMIFSCQINAKKILMKNRLSVMREVVCNFDDKEVCMDERTE